MFYIVQKKKKKKSSEIQTAGEIWLQQRMRADWGGGKCGMAHSVLKEEKRDCSKASKRLPAAWVLFLNNTPEAEVPQMSQSLCLEKRNLCLLESLGEEREETVTLAKVNYSSRVPGSEASSCHKRLCVS